MAQNSSNIHTDSIEEYKGWIYDQQQKIKEVILKYYRNHLASQNY